MTANWSYAGPAILGLTVVTVVTRAFFLYANREPRIPAGLLRALEVAPLAAIVAVLAPEIVMTQGELVSTWRDARLPAALAATLWYAWRPGVLGPLVAGLVVYLPLRIGLGW